MKDIKDYIIESLVIEAIDITSNSSVEDLDACIDYIVKYSQSLKIAKPEQQRYEKKGTPITKEIAQDLLSRRLYDNVSVRFKVDPEYFLKICKKHGITVNMSNLGFGKDSVIKWGVPVKADKKLAPKDIYLDDDEVVWYDKTIGRIEVKNRRPTGKVSFLPDYEAKAKEVLDILNRKHKGVKWTLQN